MSRIVTGKREGLLDPDLHLCLWSEEILIDP